MTILGIKRWNQNTRSAPKGTPPEIIERLNREINAATADPVMKVRLAGLGAVAVASTPAGYAERIVKDTEKWSRVIREANIMVE
jgi:tripartite-type tricarboxylate transporter receptor subunit TctC